MKKYTHANPISTKQYGYILGLMVKKNIKQQYRNSALGVIWTVLNPILNMIVMAFVFSTFFGREGIDVDYPCYLMAGNIIFGFMRTATSQSLTSIVGNRDLMTKTRVPVTIFPVSRTITALSNFGFSAIALIIIMLARYLYGKLVVFNWTMILSLLMLPALVLFSLGLGFLLATMYVKFRDIQHIYTVMLTLWTYATPIFYSLNIIKHKTVKLVISINPMTQFIEYFRESFLMGLIPSWTQFGICYAWGVGMFLIGFAIFSLSKKNFVSNI